jgi:hypothetical protein
MIITPQRNAAIEKWIADQMNGKSCSIVLIGNGTAGRKWITYEIIKTWNDKKGVLGVYIHGLKDTYEHADRLQSYQRVAGVATTIKVKPTVGVRP